MMTDRSSRVIRSKPVAPILGLSSSLSTFDTGTDIPTERHRTFSSKPSNAILALEHGLLLVMP
jgi:hypothetical protein